MEKEKDAYERIYGGPNGYSAFPYLSPSLKMVKNLGLLCSRGDMLSQDREIVSQKREPWRRRLIECFY